MDEPSRIAWRLGVSATAALSLVLAGTAPALADDTTAPDTTPPVITSTGLTDGQTVLRQSVLHPVVTATDKVGIDHTELWVDGVLHSSTGTLPRGKQVIVTRTATDQHRIVLPDSAGSSSPWQPSPLSYNDYVALHRVGPIRLDFAVHDEFGNPATLNNRVTVRDRAVHSHRGIT